MPYLLYYFCLVIKKNYLAKKWGGHGPRGPPVAAIPELTLFTPNVTVIILKNKLLTQLKCLSSHESVFS